jgi:hypothetical protein
MFFDCFKAICSFCVYCELDFGNYQKTLGFEERGKKLIGKMRRMKDSKFIRDWISGLGRLALSRKGNFWGARIGNRFWGPR